MYKGGHEVRYENRLWAARKQAGLGQKQVAYLLGQHTADQVSRYEKGERIPALKVALQLEIVYHTPVRVLFSEWRKGLLHEITGRVKSSTTLERHYQEIGDLGVDDRCSYAEIARAPSVSELELAEVRRHVAELIERFAGA